MNASYLEGSHWASWNEVMPEIPSMTGLTAAGTVHAGSSSLGGLLVSWTADRTATGTKGPDTCYAATLCKGEALHFEGDLKYCSFSLHRRSIGAFQMDWKAWEG